jgi:hypothetical protein
MRIITPRQRAATKRTVPKAGFQGVHARIGNAAKQ